MWWGWWFCCRLFRVFFFLKFFVFLLFAFFLFTVHAVVVGCPKNIKQVYAQKFSKLKLWQYNNSKITHKNITYYIPYITTFIPQNHKHLQYLYLPLPRSFLKVIITYNISTSFIFSKPSQSIHHTPFIFTKSSQLIMLSFCSFQ